MSLPSATKNPLPPNLTLPVTASVTAQHVEETINAVDTEDAVKYLPSVFLRKRNYGDTQAVMATRVWGVSSSARSLIFADGVPLTALIANNNNIGGPRWGLVAPAEIERIDLMYGPFSAAYAGNSMGAVMEITTRLPEKFEARLTQTAAWQSFKLYGTDNTYRTLQTAVTSGDRAGKFAFWVSANYQDSHSQPLSYVTSPAFPAGTTGGYAAQKQARRQCQRPRRQRTSPHAHDQREDQARLRSHADPPRRLYIRLLEKRRRLLRRLVPPRRRRPSDLCRTGRVRERLLPAARRAFFAQPHAPHQHPGQLGFRSRRHAVSF